jgi:hypothetical protein
LTPEGDEEVEVEVSLLSKKFRVRWWKDVWIPEDREELQKYINEHIIGILEIDASLILSELKIDRSQFLSKDSQGDKLFFGKGKSKYWTSVRRYILQEVLKISLSSGMEEMAAMLHNCLGKVCRVMVTCLLGTLQLPHHQEYDRMIYRIIQLVKKRGSWFR